MQAQLSEFFARYELLFRRSLGGDVDMEAVASMYAAEFIAASPAGVRSGKNDASLKQVMRDGYAYYRTIGTKDMRVRNVTVSTMDDCHCVAHVAWRATYERQGRADVVIDFVVHYLVQTLHQQPKIFGWVSGDEQALLKKHGIV